MTLGTAGELIITVEEYKELTEKALRFELLKKHLSQNPYISDVEKLLYGIEEEKKEN